MVRVEAKNLSDQSKTFTRRFWEESDESKTEAGGGKSGEFSSKGFVSKKSVDQRKFIFDSEKARNFDETRVSKAREGVKEIIKDALDRVQIKAQEIREQAYQEGFKKGQEEGYKKGEDDAKANFEPFLETLQDSINQLGTFRQQMYSKVEREMVEMVVDLAKKVIQHELSLSEDRVQKMIQLATHSVMGREFMNLRVHPQDKTYAEAYRPELHEMFGEIKNIRIEADPSIRRGDCVIETNFGTVDARLEKINEQIDKILDFAPHLPEESQKQIETKQDLPQPDTDVSDSPVEE